MAGDVDATRKLSRVTGWIYRGKAHRDSGAPAASAAEPSDSALSGQVDNAQSQPAEPAAATPSDDLEALEAGAQDAQAATRREPAVRLAVAVGLVVVVALGSLSGWFGDHAYRSHQAQQQRNLFLQVARQGAVNLTTISYTEADTDVQRILESSTGTFYDDFLKRSQAFIDVVNKAQAKSEGKVTEAGLEAEQGDQAQVLVAVTVKTSHAGTTDPQPRLWRMRLTVQKFGDGAKVSNVGFVP